MFEKQCVQLCVQEYQFTHHRSRYSNKLILCYAVDRHEIPSSQHHTTTRHKHTQVRLFRSLTPEGKRDRVMKKMIKRMETMEESLRSARLRNENLSAQVRSSNLVKQQMQRLNRDLETQVQNSALRVSQLLQQTASDREVISYLDKRSKDLDRENIELKALCKTLKASCSNLKNLKVEHEKRITYLELLGGGDDEDAVVT